MDEPKSDLQSIIDEVYWDDWEISLDGMFEKRVQLYQYKKGYRFSIDPVLLSYFVVQNTEKMDSVIDWGTGSGIIPLLLSEIYSKSEHFPPIIGVELQSSLLSLAKKNVNLNKKEEQISIISADIREFRKINKDRYTLMTFNPPYGDVERGRISHHKEKAAARHELNGHLDELLSHAVKSLTSCRGRFALVYPATGTGRLVRAMMKAGLCLSRIRYVHPFAQKGAKLVLIEGTLQESTLIVEPPLILYKEHRVYTDEAEKIFKGTYEIPYFT